MANCRSGFEYAFVKNDGREGADGRWSEGGVLGRSKFRVVCGLGSEASSVKNDGREGVDGVWCVVEFALF